MGGRKKLRWGRLKAYAELIRCGAPIKLLHMQGLHMLNIRYAFKSEGIGGSRPPEGPPEALRVRGLRLKRLV